MAKEQPKTNESKIKKVEFLKVIASNPDKKAALIGQQDFAMSSSAVYNAINEFVLNCIWSDEDKDYPNRVLNYYNKDIQDPEEQLNATDVQMLRHYVDDYYSHHLPGGDLREAGKQSVHVDNIHIPSEVTSNPRQEFQNYNSPQEQYTRRMPQPSQPFNQQEYQKRDLSSDAGYLRTLLEQGKYVHPTLIERFVKQYDMNKEVFDRDPIALLGYMKHMFTAQQGEELWKLFQKGRGKFVPDNINQMGQQQDPMQMMMLMNMLQGGNFNPQMMPFLQAMGGGGNQGYGGNGMDMNQMMMMMMMSQMGQKSQKDQQKQDMNELFEKMIQAIMLKMVGGAAEDKKPWDVYGMYGGGMMPGMMGPPQIQEVMDASGRVTQRNIVPSFGMGGHPNQPDPVLMSVLNNTMNTNTQLLMKVTDAGKTPTDILLGMIPYFKDSGNSALQLSQMFKTMNEMFPGFFNKSGQEAGNVEIAKLKLDTDLALQAQRMELAKMEHTWRIDEMDRKANNDNAQNWMRMIETLGGSFTDKVAPALLEGFGKGGLIGGKGGGPGGQGPGQGQMDPMAAQMRMQNMRMKQMQEQEREARMTEAQREQQREQQKQVQQMQEQQQMSQQQAMFAIAQLQTAVQQRDKYIQDLTRQMQDIQNQPTQRYQGGPQQVNEQQLLRLQTGELQQMLREINNQSSQESSLKSRIETILANRSIMDQQVVPQPQEEVQSQSVDEPGTETEDISSQETRDFEEPNN